jgi:hypothetical protein
VRRVREDVGIAIDRVVVNALPARPLPPGLEDLDLRLRRIPDGTPLGALPAPSVLAACTAHLHARWALHERWAETLAASIGLPCVRLPYLPDGVAGPDALARLGQALVAGPAAEAS